MPYKGPMVGSVAYSAVPPSVLYLYPIIKPRFGGAFHVRSRVAVVELPAASVATAVTTSRPSPAVATEEVQPPLASTATGAPFTVRVEPISAVPETVTPPAASAALIRSSPPSIVVIATAGPTGVDRQVVRRRRGIAGRIGLAADVLVRLSDAVGFHHLAR